MKVTDVVNEIELVGDQSFPLEKIKTILAKSRPSGMLDNEFVINYLEHNNNRVIILTDDDKNIAAFAGFQSWNNGKVWQAKNAETFAPYKGRALVARIYKFAKESLKQSIQSDVEQTVAGRTLWTKTLPSIGLKPMIFDTSTERVIDPAEFDLSKLYSDVTTPESIRYSWIIETYDRYSSTSLLEEDSILLPLTGLWKTKL